jgi:hypothetical protein
VGFALTREGRATNPQALHHLSCQLLNLLSEPLPLLKATYKPDTVVGVLHLPETQLFLGFQVPRVSQSQTLPGNKSLWPSGNSWSQGTPTATEVVFYFCCYPQELELTPTREVRATNHHALYCPSSRLLKLLTGSMSDTFLSMTTSHSCLLPRYCGLVSQDSPSCDCSLFSHSQGSSVSNSS